MRNYFKVGSAFFFFNGAKVTETSAAFEKAMAAASDRISSISLYQLPSNPGPWDRAGLVGHRRRGEILADIASETDPLELDCRKAELARLERAYFDAGRDHIPTVEVAA